MRFRLVAPVFLLAQVLIGVENASASYIMLAWDPDPTGVAAGYVVSYGTASGVYTSSIDVGNQNRIEIAGLASGTTYFLAVRAYPSSDHTLLSSYSTEVSGTPSSTANAFGLPDPANEGSVTGVSTLQSTTPLTVLPQHDLAVTFSSVSVAGSTWAGVTENQRVSNAGVGWGAWVYQVGTSAIASGPVTIGIAFDPAILTARVAPMKMIGATISSVDMTNHIVYGTVPSLPATVIVLNDRAAMNTDVDGDGKGDLLFWNNATGSLALWQMNGASITTASMLTPSSVSDTTWTVVGMGDFNNDGHPDLLWRNSLTGTFGVWYMNGTTQIGSAMLNPTGLSNLDWTVVSVADFDLDGQPDLLWRNSTTGQLAVWFMNGVNLRSVSLLNPSAFSDLNWKIYGVADFNGDGYPDILWRRDGTGQFGLWLMNGVNETSAVMLNPQTIGDLNWQIAGIVDINGDGNPDVIWRNVSTGGIAAWLMNRINEQAPVMLGPGSLALQWVVVGAR